jgi:DNA polymerase
MSNIHSSFLKEMGITEWSSRDPATPSVEASSVAVEPLDSQQSSDGLSASPRWHWWFFGGQPQADAQILFQNMVRILGLSSSEWTWLKPSDKLSALQAPSEDIPVIAIAFGSSAVQKLTGERDPLALLRETVLAMDGEGNEEIPVLASFELNHFLGKPKDKALLWQDLLLAKSVLLST